MSRFIRSKAEIALVEAVDDCNLEAIKSIVESHAGIINCLVTDDHGQEATPLMMAVRKGNLELAQYLVLETKAYVNTKNKHDNTALSIAAKLGHLELLQFLIARGADKEHARRLGGTPLYSAAEKGHVAVVQYLLEQGVDKDKVSSCGASPLRVAAGQGHSAVVKCLLEHGADKDKADYDDFTPLLVAALRGHFPVVQHLLEHGADLDKATNEGCSPFHIAAAWGHLDIVQLLLEQHGVDKDKVDNESETPLFTAARNDRLDVVEYLVDVAGVDVNKACNENNTEYPRFTPLHAAVVTGAIDVAICLMERGMADLNAETADGLRPIDLAENDEGMIEAIVNEEKRRRDHGFRRAVLPNPIAAEQEATDRARGEAEDENEIEVQGSANAMVEEDDGVNDDSGSDEPHEEAYLKSLKRPKIKS